MSSINLLHDVSLPFYNTNRPLEFPNMYMILNNQIVDIVEYSADNQLLLPDVILSKLLFTTHLLKQGLLLLLLLPFLLLLLLEIDIDKCLLIPVVLLQFPLPLLPPPPCHLFHE